MNKSKFISKNDKGFTLAELILSVCILAIISVYMLQFFISASDLNRRAEDLDHSVFLANSVVEWLKSDQWNEKGPYVGLILASDQKQTDGTVYTADYDQRWNLVPAGDEKALFHVKVVIKPDKEVQADRALYAINVEIRRLRPYFKGKLEEPVIYTLESKEYVHLLKEVPVQ